MVAFEDHATIDGFLQGQTRHPMARKHVGDRVVYRCHNDFGPIHKGLGKMISQITDFGLAQPGSRAEPLIHPIQPNEFRAPEVLLGIGWSYSADMWNFGAMVSSLLPIVVQLTLVDIRRSGSYWPVNLSSTSQGQNHIHQLSI